MVSAAIYNKHGDEIVEIQIRDSTGRKIDNFIFHAHDKKSSRKVFGMIITKYGIDITPEYFDDKENKLSEDLLW